mmetsp:Transcript_100465/g.178251  ORF Transcript_100465/g.178251 Transcript_100465/m.178251 type:complete len:469 (+) Transcript_100465:177-1583(+)
MIVRPPRTPGLVVPPKFPPGVRPPTLAQQAAAANVPDAIRDQYKHLREDFLKMEAAATEAESRGDVEGSKFKMMLLGDMNEKIKELEEQYPGLTLPAPKAPPPTPAVGGPPTFQDMAAMYQGAQLNMTQQQALLYDQQKAMSRTLEPEVVEFQAKFGLQDRHAWMLNEQLKARNNTYDDDIWSLHYIMEKCNNTAQRCDLLNMNVRWMAEGKFTGAFSPNPLVIKAAKKFKLDPPSACKLADALEAREDPDSDMNKINAHLERSNKPSSLVMMMLKVLKAGNAIEEANKPIAVGSWLHKQEAQKESEKKQRRSRSRKGDRDAGRRRSRSNRRPRGGSRERQSSRGAPALEDREPAGYSGGGGRRRSDSRAGYRGRDQGGRDQGRQGSLHYDEPEPRSRRPRNDSRDRNYGGGRQSYPSAQSGDSWYGDDQWQRSNGRDNRDDWQRNNGRDNRDEQWQKSGGRDSNYGW